MDMFEWNPPKRSSLLTAMALFLTMVASTIAGIVVVVLAFITHLVVTLKTASYVLLLIGLLVPPIGVLHGVGTWFGWWP